MDWKDPEQLRTYYRERSRRYRQTETGKAEIAKYRARLTRDGKNAIYSRRYRERHAETHTRSVINWQKKNPERHHAIKRAYYARNKERINALRRMQRQQSLDETRQRDRHRYQRDRASRIKASHIQLRKRMQSPGFFTREEWLHLLRAYEFRCAYCHCEITASTSTKDHCTPLSRGGSNDISNIVPSCLPCNQRKGVLTADEFIARLQKSVG